MIPLGFLAASRHVPAGPVYYTWTPPAEQVDNTPIEGWTSTSESTWSKDTHEGVPYVYHMASSGLSATTYAITNDEWGDSFSDVEVLLDVLGPPITTNTNIGPRLRGPDLRTGYYCYPVSGVLTIFRQDVGVTGNVRETLGTAATPTNPTFDVPHKIRFQAIGSTLRGKMWPAADEEPDWMVTVTDSVFATGYVGVVGQGRGFALYRTFSAIEVWEL